MNDEPTYKERESDSGGRQPPAWSLRVVGLLEGLRPRYGRDDYRTPDQLTEQARMVAEDGPRCDTCRWWQHKHRAGIGECEKAIGSHPFTGSMRVGSLEEWSEHPPFLETDAGFGCVKWEPRDDD